MNLAEYRTIQLENLGTLKASLRGIKKHLEDPELNLTQERREQLQKLYDKEYEHVGKRINKEKQRILEYSRKDLLGIS